MSGAAVLAGLACLRSGAGLVRLAVPTECQPAVAAQEPCLMTVGLPQSKQGKFSWAAWQALQEPARWADVIALGPGLDRSFALSRLVGEAFVHWPQPMVVDADGLNALASGPPLAPAGPRVLTPHPGEFARLARRGISDRRHGRDGGRRRSTLGLDSLAQRPPHDCHRRPGIAVSQCHRQSGHGHGGLR